MPMYDYYCAKCDLTIGLARAIKDRRNRADCPHCGEEMKFDPYPRDSVQPEGRPDIKDPFRKF